MLKVDKTVDYGFLLHKCLIKPAVKEKTRPLDLKLHSDIRAAERSEFDQQIADKLAQIEMYKQERERLRKLAEEEEIRRLRREQVPKAQRMPYFDRPFVPKRLLKGRRPSKVLLTRGDPLDDSRSLKYERSPSENDSEPSDCIVRSLEHRVCKMSNIRSSCENITPMHHSYCYLLGKP